jgi:hypothetical protein
LFFISLLKEEEKRKLFFPTFVFFFFFFFFFVSQTQPVPQQQPQLLNKQIQTFLFDEVVVVGEKQEQNPNKKQVPHSSHSCIQSKQKRNIVNIKVFLFSFFLICRKMKRIYILNSLTCHNITNVNKRNKHLFVSKKQHKTKQNRRPAKKKRVSTAKLTKHTCTNSLLVRGPPTSQNNLQKSTPKCEQASKMARMRIGTDTEDIATLGAGEGRKKSF